LQAGNRRQNSERAKLTGFGEIQHWYLSIIVRNFSPLLYFERSASPKTSTPITREKTLADFVVAARNCG